jgi:16S rRNA (adenine1518-N6/adenine1519-N6)-dimethyltransferase
MTISIKQTKAVMQACGVNVKKGLGQSFLIQEKYLHAIAKACEIKHSDCVLEIGTGTGQLTQYLAGTPHRFVTVEIDEKIQSVAKILLQETFPRIEWVLGDILKLDLKPYYENQPPLKIVGNLPYYITTPIMMTLLETHIPFERMVIMIQREVANRIIAKSGNKDYGVLTLMVQYYATVERIIEVPRGAFYPAPDVDSTVLRLKPHTIPPVTVKDQKLLFLLIRSSFTQRRKKLINSLQSAVSTKGYNKETICPLLLELGISPDARVEELTLQDFANITNRL